MINLPFGVSAILFDLDNTLFDRDRAFQAWACTFVRSRLGIEDKVEQAGALDHLITLDAHEHGAKTTMFTAMKVAYPGLQPSVDALITAFREEMLSYCTLDGEATHLLQTLQQAKIPFGIVTNGSGSQLGRIQALGLAELTNCIFVSELVGSRKPDAAIFRAAAACLNLQPDQILFVGDTPEADIVGAHHVGMRTAWLRRSGRTWPSHLASTICDQTIATLAELPQVCSPT